MASTCKADRSANVLSLWSYFWWLVGLRRLVHYWNGQHHQMLTISRVSRLTEFSNCTKWPEFLTKDSDFPARGLSIFRRKVARA
jgi:hypothetical protein